MKKSRIRPKWANSLSLQASVLTSLALGLNACGEQNIDRRVLPEKTIPGSFIVEMNVSQELAASERLRQIAKKISRTISARASLEPIAWEKAESGVLSTQLDQNLHLNFYDCRAEEGTELAMMEGCLILTKFQTQKQTPF